MNTVYNFSAGPAVLPKEVLKTAQEELLNYRNTGMSVMEMSHRSKVYDDILQEAKASVKRLMNIPDTHSILFLQGGASLQFHMLAVNYAQGKDVAYVDTGNWSQKAMDEAARFGRVHCIASSKDKNYSYIPEFDHDVSKYAYLHLTTNNTLEGTAFTDLPDTKGVPLILDASSNILSCNIDVSKCALIYAGAQKNIGAAGVTMVIIDNNFKSQVEYLPPMLSYETMIKADSLYNTPATYGIYISGLVFKWLEELGGVPAMIELNKKKSQLLYDFIDSSDYYSSPVDKASRSLTNIPFKTRSEELDAKFVKEAEALGLLNLKGHRLIGGMRASLYNAFPIEGVHALIDFMKKFQGEN